MDAAVELSVVGGMGGRAPGNILMYNINGKKVKKLQICTPPGLRPETPASYNCACGEFRRPVGEGRQFHHPPRRRCDAQAPGVGIRTSVRRRR